MSSTDESEDKGPKSQESPELTYTIERRVGGGGGKRAEERNVGRNGIDRTRAKPSCPTNTARPCGRGLTPTALIVTPANYNAPTALIVTPASYNAPTSFVGARSLHSHSKSWSAGVL
ncbi:hypothetical protein E2C01_044785 [Portunus trituberculatus]|uniref:Uncharacterized protein n=1 Tax=Portunus trituberculatus TaxID=210409 RepID=A0A5B7FT09_PORTR|nr:hypothetical protein [Portunus trituberculatus]